MFSEGLMGMTQNSCSCFNRDFYRGIKIGKKVYSKFLNTVLVLKLTGSLS